MTSTARVFTFGYDADLMNRSSIATMSDIAGTILAGINRERSTAKVCYILGLFELLESDQKTLSSNVALSSLSAIASAGLS